MKRILLILLAVSALPFVGCGETKTLHCDGCGIEVQVDANSNMDEDWILYCSKCEKEKGLDTLIVEE